MLHPSPPKDNDDDPSRPDFVLLLSDVSSSLRSRARRVITSVVTLGLALHCVTCLCRPHEREWELDRVGIWKYLK